MSDLTPEAEDIQGLMKFLIYQFSNSRQQLDTKIDELRTYFDIKITEMRRDVEQKYYTRDVLESRFQILHEHNDVLEKKIEQQSLLSDARYTEVRLSLKETAEKNIQDIKSLHTERLSSTDRLWVRIGVATSILMVIATIVNFFLTHIH